ncbi:tripartite tricarboxylate transporter substrate binding protein [Candidatus Formimonas warabiya]|uniref:Tripartite tricarboxylate transporter substrate binding protein n=1 Tax=Formimonas warabiya TaxID=1761012 RepID=A0A3G1KLX1_FORW1|nr:tripartite tricarboxylate transporter substrate binding protein [Candidatus Formimonas warabiya]ATW23476.1 hypothetical protein DCMF_00495 [Candidatus Formimonas warabiya]
MFRNKRNFLFNFIGLLTLIALMVLVAGCGSSEKLENEAEQQPEAQAPAPEFPTKPITLVVSWGAGGGNDIVARSIAAIAEKDLGQPVNVVNVPGAGAEIGFTQIAKAEPDGYTIGMIATPTIGLNTLDRETTYKLDDFKILLGLASDPRVIAVAADSKFQTIEDLIKYGKDNPGKLRIGHGGVGTHAQYAALDFGEKNGLDIIDVPFEGAASAISAVLGKHVEASCPAVGEVLSNVKSGQMKVLVVLENSRSPELPDVPCAKDLGWDMAHTSVRGLMGPKDMPQDVADILTNAFKKAMETEDFQKQMKDAGVTVQYMTGDDLTKLVQDHVVIYKPIVEAVKAKQEKK